MPPSAPISRLLPYSYHAKAPSADPLLFHVHTAGCNYVDSDFEIRRDETYPYCTIHLLFDGCGFFRIAGKNHFLTKGDVFIITPGEAHTYCNFTSDSLGLIWVEVSGVFCKELFRVLKTNGVYAFHQSPDNILTDCLLDLLSCLKETNAENPYEVSAKVYSFFMHLLYQADHHVTRKPSQLFSAALNYIEEHLSENIPVQSIAGELQISSTYLNRLFHKYTGTSTIRYIRLKRIEYACALLSGTELSCEAIGEKTGFYDASCFGRTFKEITGHTPAEYRRQNLKKL